MKVPLYKIGDNSHGGILWVPTAQLGRNMGTNAKPTGFLNRSTVYDSVAQYIILKILCQVINI